MREFHQAESLFHLALALPSGIDRAPGSPLNCAGDAELLREVSALLDARVRMEGATRAEESIPSPRVSLGLIVPSICSDAGA
jgi:hypothetical protein